MKDIGLILGIRPDVIRASKIIKLLHESSDIDFDFIWSGQHYSENMQILLNKDGDKISILTEWGESQEIEVKDFSRS